MEETAAKVLPPGVKGNMKGTAKRIIASTVHDTALLILAATVVMYIVLGILYESFVHPLTILSSLPFADWEDHHFACLRPAALLI